MEQARCILKIRINPVPEGRGDVLKSRCSSVTIAKRFSRELAYSGAGNSTPNFNAGRDLTFGKGGNFFEAHLDPPCN